jgi:UDP-N-acetylglucosamine--N-acetylmuramyl-(pentapeptide) pyrophosphoryl-undecaprenol N-acetylglucosamine transferase
MQKLPENASHAFNLNRKKKLVFAAGGTGGHLFPAQALAEKLLKENSNLELLFAGAKLSQNPYFDKSKFCHHDILSMTPFRGNVLHVLKSFSALFKGVRESLELFQKQKPDLVIGFGSFHSFPLLCAAVIKKIPLILFESNAVPGKVVRLFSKKALFTGIFFPETQAHLKGKTIEVEIPSKNTRPIESLSKHDARQFFQLDPNRLTLLVFGGSQGAKQINQEIMELIPLLSKNNLLFQLIHFTGNKETAADIAKLCREWDIPHYVKDFEAQMHIAWSAADIAICRSGAMTLSEILHYEVPAILIPYPHAADQHQLKNALFLEKKVGGGIHFKEELFSVKKMQDLLISLMQSESLLRSQMKQAIKNFKVQQNKSDLAKLILKLIKEP